MESNADGKNGKLSDPIYYGKGNLTRNSSMPKNLNAHRIPNSQLFQGKFLYNNI